MVLEIKEEDVWKVIRGLNLKRRIMELERQIAELQREKAELEKEYENLDVSIE